MVWFGFARNFGPTTGGVTSHATGIPTKSIDLVEIRRAADNPY